MADDSQKQVGSLYLDQSTLKKNIEEANGLLKTLGKDVDFSESIKESVKKSLSAVNDSVKSSGESVRKTLNTMFNDSAASAKDLLRQIQTIGKNVKFDFSDSISKQQKASVEKATKELKSVAIPTSTSTSSTSKSSSKTGGYTERDIINNLNEQLRIKKQINGINQSLAKSNASEAESFAKIKAEAQAQLAVYQRQYNHIVRQNPALETQLKTQQKKTAISNNELQKTGEIRSFLIEFVIPRFQFLHRPCFGILLQAY